MVSLRRPRATRPSPIDRIAYGRVTGRVLRHDFHGHDTVTFVCLANGTELHSRCLNDTHGATAEPGTTVTISIYGAVRAWTQEGSALSVERASP
jgi:iron(III) transport system ATP-binding protein